MMNETTEALNRIAAALERLADVYLYVNDPEQDGPDADVAKVVALKVMVVPTEMTVVSNVVQGELHAIRIMKI